MLTIIVTWYNCNFTLDTLVDARRAHYQYIINSRFTNQQQCIGEVHWCIGALVHWCMHLTTSPQSISPFDNGQWKGKGLDAVLTWFRVIYQNKNGGRVMVVVVVVLQQFRRVIARCWFNDCKPKLSTVPHVRAVGHTRRAQSTKSGQVTTDD